MNRKRLILFICIAIVIGCVVGCAPPPIATPIVTRRTPEIIVVTPDSPLFVEYKDVNETFARFHEKKAQASGKIFYSMPLGFQNIGIWVGDKKVHCRLSGKYPEFLIREGRWVTVVGKLATFSETQLSMKDCKLNF